MAQFIKTSELHLINVDHIIELYIKYTSLGAARYTLAATVSGQDVDLEDGLPVANYSTYESVSNAINCVEDGLKAGVAIIESHLKYAINTGC